jgi:Ca-activated chloride channel family protein
VDELHLLRPQWLWALVPAILIWLGLWRLQDRVAEWKKLIDPHLLEHLLVERGRRHRLRPIHLTLVLWVLCAVALAGPTWEREPSPFADDQAGLMVLLKASETMNATDVQPSRLERAKHKLTDLLEQREGAATGLVAYSGSAHLVMPLTRDRRIVTTMAAEISPAIMPVDGDALLDAIGEAARVFDRAGVPGSVLVIADAVSPSQADAMAAAAPELPVQFLAVTPVNAPLDPGLQQAAQARNAKVIRLTIDQVDVERIARTAQTDFRATPMDEAGEHWKDAGYLVVPLIALVALAWSRKGWVVS